MCNLYQMTPKGSTERAIAEAGFLLTGGGWDPVTVGPLGAGAFLLPGAAGELRAVVVQWGMIRPGQPERRPEKRSLVHIDGGNWEQWLRGTADEALAGGQGGLFCPVLVAEHGALPLLHAHLPLISLHATNVDAAELTGGHFSRPQPGDHLGEGGTAVSYLTRLA